MTELDHLDQLERELGPALRTRLHRMAAAISDEDRDALPLDDLEVAHVVVGPTWRTGGWHRRKAWVVAAAVVLLAVGALLARTLVSTGRDDVGTVPASPGPTPTTVPAPSTTVPLLPDGAPTGAATSELVASINVRHRGVFRLYADGRLIQPWSVSEQRLTPEGVERVRAHVLASAVFDGAQPVSEIDTLCAVHACVRDGDHWLDVEVDVLGGTASQASSETTQLFDDLINLHLWLPASEWVEQQPEPYVPGLIGTCVSLLVDGSEIPFDPSLLASRSPAPAAEVLAAHERSTEMESLLVPLTLFSGGPSEPVMPAESVCFELTLAEARTLADAYLATSGAAALERGILVSFGQQPDPSHPGATREEAAGVSFFRLLPDKWPLEVFGD